MTDARFVFTWKKPILVTIAAIAQTYDEKVCLAGVDQEGNWIRLVNIDYEHHYAKNDEDVFWKRNRINNFSSFNRVQLGEQFMVWGSYVIPKYRGSVRHHEDFQVEYLQSVGQISDLFGFMTQICISMNHFPEYMKAGDLSLFAIQVSGLTWSRDTKEYPAFLGKFYDDALHNTYEYNRFDGLYRITANMFFESVGNQYCENLGEIGRCIVVIGFSRKNRQHTTNKPLIVSIIEESDLLC